MGYVFIGGVEKPNDILNNPKLNEAYEMGYLLINQN